MDVAEKLWSSGDIDGTLREVQKILVSPKQDHTTINEALLLSAYVHFQLGKLHESNELLSRVKYKTFDIFQWIIENNVLVIKYLENRRTGVKEMNVIQHLATLLEKIQGLPCHDVLLLEIHVSFNFGLSVLASNTREGSSIPGAYDKCQSKIQLTIDRVLGTGLLSDLSIMDKLRFFSEGGETNKNLDEVVFPLSWLCWLLSLFWLIDYRVKDAQQLIQLVIKFNKIKSQISNLKKVRSPFSIMVDGINEDAIEGLTILIAACHLVLCYGSFLNHNKKESLNQCNLCLNAKPGFLPALLIKGLILYERGEHCDAFEPLQQVLTLTQDNSYKATALNILGCACAKSGKPHTALLKFRNSFASSYSHVEALYNVGLLYHELKDYDLEISLLQHLLKILSQRKSIEAGPPNEQIKVSYIAGIAARTLDRIISTDRLLISADVYCIQTNYPCNSQLNRYAVLYKIAHNCLQLNRYGEAAESFLNLLALMNDNPVDAKKISLPSLIGIFHETAVCLCQSGRHQDTLTICDKVLFQRPALSVPTQEMRPTAKRSQENVFDVESWVETKSLVGIMLCKAEALIQLERPVEADELYRRILDLMNKEFRNLCPCEISDTESTKQDHKRQKTDAGSKGTHKCDAESQRNIEEYQKLKAMVFDTQGVLLKSLGRKREALLVFARSISCEPSCIKYHYDHTSLLFDLGKNEEASENWLKVRKLDQKEEGSVDTNTMITDRDDFFYLNNEDPSLYIAMDAMALKNSRRKF